MTTERIRLRLDRLQALLAESRLTQNHWAIKLGLSRGHWSDIVNGKHPYPSAKTRDRLIELFGLPFEELFNVEDSRIDGAAAFKAALQDRYAIDQEVGQGGMGTVYLARDVRHGRTVAIKMVSAEAVAGIGAIQFLKEIRTTARLQHHHILPLFDSGMAADSPYYVMPYIAGGSLRDLLEQRGALSVPMVLQLLDGISQALTYAHASKILHCDIKPENILLSGTHPFVADFGISRAIHAEVFEWGVRHSIDSSAGTPAYVSPEQASGERNLDERSDVYSLACMTYEMLSGHPPFVGTTTMEVVAQRFTIEIPDVRQRNPTVPYAVSEHLQHAMSIPSERRPASIHLFAEQLRRATLNSSPPTIVRRVMSPIGRAARRASRWFGVTPGGITLDSLLSDVRFAWRSFARRPAFAVLAILTIALGIGASTAMFSIVNAVLIRPLEYPDPESVVSIYPSYPELINHPTLGEFAMRGTFSWPEVFALREQQTSFVGVAAYRFVGGTLAGEGTPLRVRLFETNYELFQILGVRPHLGRLFGPADDFRVQRVALVAYGYWRDRLGGDTALVGQTIQIDDEPVEVVGILPEGFRVATLNVQMWIPKAGSPTDDNIGNHNINGAIARLASGVSAEQAQEEMARILVAAVPANHGTHGASVYPRLQDETRNARTPLVALIAGSVLLLAVGCGNVAAILLGAGIDREQELAVRCALGASRKRVARQLLTESIVLSVVGGVAGIGVALLAMRSLLAMAPQGLPRIGTTGIDGTALMFAMGVATLTGAAFGLIPAIGLSNIDPGKAITSSRGTTTQKARAHAAVVIGELALATVLMMSGGLLTRSLFALNNADLGFDSDGLGAIAVAVPYQRFREDTTGTQLGSYFRRIVEEVGAIPSITDVSITSNTPLTGDRGNNTLLPEGWADGPDNGVLAERRFISRNFFSTMRIPILEGRAFTREDRAEGANSIILTRALADLSWPGEPPLGKRIRHWGNWHTVVGVVGEVRDEALESPTDLAFYVPYPETTGEVGNIVFRASGDPAETLNSVRERIWSVYPDLPITRAVPLKELVSDSTDQQRYRARLMTAFAVLAAAFATLGIYGVTARSVSQRSQEMAIRMALGAEPTRVMHLILRQGLLVAAAGGLLGMALAVGAGRYMKEILYEVTVFDPIVLGTIVLVISAASIMASIAPAVKATRVDPMTMIRPE